jgi:hypothetical protein
VRPGGAVGIAPCCCAVSFGQNIAELIIFETLAVGAGGSKQPVQVIVGEGFGLGRADQVLSLSQVAIRYKLLRCLKETGHPDS